MKNQEDAELLADYMVGSLHKIDKILITYANSFVFVTLPLPYCFRCHRKIN